MARLNTAPTSSACWPGARSRRRWRKGGDCCSPVGSDQAPPAWDLQGIACIEFTGVAMSDNAVLSRRGLVNLSGAAILSSGLPATTSYAQLTAPPAAGAVPDRSEGSTQLSSAAVAVAEYAAKAL